MQGDVIFNRRQHINKQHHNSAGPANSAAYTGAAGTAKHQPDQIKPPPETTRRHGALHARDAAAHPKQGQLRKHAHVDAAGQAQFERQGTLDTGQLLDEPGTDAEAHRQLLQAQQQLLTFVNSMVCSKVLLAAEQWICCSLKVVRDAVFPGGALVRDACTTEGASLHTHPCCSLGRPCASSCNSQPICITQVADVHPALFYLQILQLPAGTTAAQAQAIIQQRLSDGGCLSSLWCHALLDSGLQMS
jgi:hypothetical protein